MLVRVVLPDAQAAAAIDIMLAQVEVIVLVAADGLHGGNGYCLGVSLAGRAMRSKSSLALRALRCYPSR